MNARFDEREIPVAGVTLDDFAWDRRDSASEHSIVVRLSDAELRHMAQRLVDYAKAAVAEESDYFDAMPEVLVPTSEAMFVGDAAMLERYLRDEFWRREAVIALLEVGRGPRPATPAYLIVGLRDVTRDDGGALVTFTAKPAPTVAFQVS